MNETIGEIGGHNDQKRRIRIKREQRKKLDEYEEERKIKDLEKKVKKQQLITLIKVLPIAVVGGTIKTIYDTGKKSSGKKSVSSDGVIIEENNDGITQLDRDYDVSDSKEKQFIEEATSKKKIVTTPTGEKVVVELPKARKEEKKTFFEELFFPTEAEKKPNEISINGEVKKNDEEKLTPFTGISISSDTFYDTIEDLDIDSDMLPDYMKEKIEKLKSRKIVEEYEKELKNIRYELRNLVFEYSILEEESDNIIISDEANIILDKLSLIIDKLEELKQKIFDNCNPNKWICMSAERVVVLDSGEYIMLAMTSQDKGDALIKAFKEYFDQNVGPVLDKTVSESFEGGVEAL